MTFQTEGGGGGEGTCIIYLTSPEGLISFSSLSSLTHSRQLIISLFPQIPQCTCNYHAHACLPQASCLEGGVSLSFSLSASLSFLPLFLAVLFPITCLFFVLFVSYIKLLLSPILSSCFSLIACLPLISSLCFRSCWYETQYWLVTVVSSLKASVFKMTSCSKCDKGQILVVHSCLAKGLHSRQCEGQK